MEYRDLTRLASGHVEARAVQTAITLKVFDVLGEKGSDARSIAVKLECDERATEILLNALAALSLVEKKEARFFLNDISATYLVSGSPKYLGGMICFDASLWNAWEKLEQTIRTGNPARTPDMYQSETEETEIFIEAMDSLVKARGDAEIVARTVDLSSVHSLLDVGSGPATYPIYFCKTYSRLSVTIFDLPGTLEITAKHIATAGLEDRIRLIPGDYRKDAIPGRYEVAFLSNIIHAEGSEENSRLMKKIYDGLESGGRIVVKDHILDDSLTSPPVGAIFSLLMLLTTRDGRCYSFNEIKAWLEAAGFAEIAELKLPTPLTSSLVTGRKS